MLVQKVKPSKSKAAVVVMKLDTTSGMIRHCGRTGVYKWQDDETACLSVWCYHACAKGKGFRVQGGSSHDYIMRLDTMSGRIRHCGRTR